MSETPKCDLCGEPMPTGEEMFRCHGYSGPCPTPPKPSAEPSPEDIRELCDSLDWLLADPDNGYSPQANAEVRKRVSRVRFALRSRSTGRAWQCCPICNGRGRVDGNFYIAGGSSSTADVQCRTCGGAGVVVTPLDSLPAVPEEGKP